MSDIQFIRRMVFEHDVNEKDQWWQWRMLQAIEVAKRLGFKNFEMDVSGEAAQEQPEENSIWRSIVFGSLPNPEIAVEEWKSAPETNKKRPRRQVRVWAVVAVNAQEMENVR